MQINQQKFAALAAAVSGAAYLVCSVFVYLWPNTSSRLIGALIHAPGLENLFTYRVSPLGVLVGLLEVVIYLYIAGWLFAWIFNRSLKS